MRRRRSFGRLKRDKRRGGEKEEFVFILACRFDAESWG
jgi:hypothetical protein